MKDITIVLWATANNGDNYIKKEFRITKEDIELLIERLTDDIPQDGQVIELRRNFEKLIK